MLEAHFPPASGRVYRAFGWPLSQGPQGKPEPWYRILTLQGHLRILALNGYAGFCDAFFIPDNAGIEGSIVDLAIPLQAIIGATNGTPFAFELSRFQISPVRRERLADGVTIPLPRRIDQHSSVTNRNSYALATKTRPPRVLSLPRTGGLKAACLRGGLVPGAGIWAGDASSPAQSSLMQRSSLPPSADLSRRCRLGPWRIPTDYEMEKLTW
jgi:hypothetical protein